MPRSGPSPGCPAPCGSARPQLVAGRGSAQRGPARGGSAQHGPARGGSAQHGPSTAPADGGPPDKILGSGRCSTEVCPGRSGDGGGVAQTQVAVSWRARHSDQGRPGHRCQRQTHIVSESRYCLELVVPFGSYVSVIHLFQRSALGSLCLFTCESETSVGRYLHTP